MPPRTRCAVLQDVTTSGYKPTFRSVYGRHFPKIVGLPKFGPTGPGLFAEPLEPTATGTADINYEHVVQQLS